MHHHIAVRFVEDKIGAQRAKIVQATELLREVASEMNLQEALDLNSAIMSIEEVTAKLAG